MISKKISLLLTMVLINVFHLRAMKTLSAMSHADQTKWLQLVEASKNCNISEIIKQLENGAPINGPLIDTRRNLYKDTPLRWATISGHAEAARLLIQRGAVVDAQDSSGCTPLYEAVAKGLSELAELLIKAGSNVNIPRSSGQTALHIAAIRGNVALVHMLLNAGAQVNQITNAERDPFYNAQGIISRLGGYRKGMAASPLIMAADAGQTEVARVLIEAHADIHIQDAQGYTALMRAIESDRIETAQLLIHVKTSLHAQNEGGLTALHLAAQNGHLAIVKTLIDAGVDVTIPTRTGQTALDIAKEKRFAQIVELLRASQPITTVVITVTNAR